MLIEKHLEYPIAYWGKSEHKLKVEAFEKLIKENGPYDLWANITSAATMEAAALKKMFRHFMRTVNTKKRFLIPNYAWCFVLFDRTNSRDGVHIHALIRGVDPKKAKIFQRKCISCFGVSKVMKYDASRQPNATLYLANKYCSSKLADFAFMKIDPRRKKYLLMNRQKIQL